MGKIRRGGAAEVVSWQINRASRRSADGGTARPPFTTSTWASLVGTFLSFDLSFCGDSVAPFFRGLGTLCIAVLTLAFGPERAGDVPVRAGTIFKISGVNADDRLNLREFPTANSSILVELPSSAQLIATGRATRSDAETWLEVSYSAHRGWVNAWFVQALPPTPRRAVRNLKQSIGPSAGTLLRPRKTGKLGGVTLHPEASQDSPPIKTLDAIKTDIVATGWFRLDGPRTWYQVTSGDQRGWVDSRFVEAAIASILQTVRRKRQFERWKSLRIAKATPSLNEIERTRKHATSVLPASTAGVTKILEVDRENCLGLNKLNAGKRSICAWKGLPGIWCTTCTVTSLCSEGSGQSTVAQCGPPTRSCETACNDL